MKITHRLFTVSLVFVAIATSPVAALDWAISSPDPMEYSGMFSSLQLDPSGFPRVSYCTAFGSEDYRVRYAAWDGASWQIETVSSVGTGVSNGTSLVLDNNSSPHISYNSRLYDHGMEYAYRDDSTWQIETVDGGHGASVGPYNSLALDSAGWPRLSYRDNTIVRNKYAQWNGTGWNIEVSGQDGVPDFPYGCLLVDEQDVSHLAGSGLSYAVRTDSGWSVENGIAPGGKGARLVLDSQGNPHIAHCSVSDDMVRYTHWDGLQWHTQVIEGNAHYGGGAPLVFDASGKPRIAYLVHDEDHCGGTYVHFAAWDGAQWQIEQIGTDHASGSYGVCLKMDDIGQYHVTYYGHNLGLRYAVAIPEPATLSLLAVGAVALIRRKRN